MGFSWCLCPGLLPEYIRVGVLTHIEGDFALQSEHICAGMKCLQRVAKYRTQHFVISIIFELSKVYPVSLIFLYSVVQND